MATRVRDRKPSPIQYIETMRHLIIHTDFYMAKLPKALTFTKRVPISQMLLEAANCLISANGIKAICKEDWLKRRDLLQNALGAVNALDFHLSILIDTQNYFTLLGEFAWEEWGRLISEERRLILGVLEKDKEKGLG